MYVLGENNKLSFLDVSLLRNGSNIETTVYRKPRNSNVYLDWKSFALDTWRQGTLKTLIK